MERGKRHMAWWWYFWFLLALTVATLFFSLDGPTEFAWWAFDGIGLVGLWAYLRGRPIGSRRVWRIYFLRRRPGLVQQHGAVAERAGGAICRRCLAQRSGHDLGGVLRDHHSALRCDVAICFSQPRDLAARRWQGLKRL